MLVAFFESVKYVGHLFPVAFLRIFVGHLYLTSALDKYYGDFFRHPRLAESIQRGLDLRIAPHWYQQFLENIVLPHGQVCSYIFFGMELLVGISFLLGYMVRPFAVIGLFLCFHFLCLNNGPFADLQRMFVAVHITLAWLGAGRCLGIDYFFYKRHRGLLW